MHDTLEVFIPKGDLWDESTDRFVCINMPESGVTLKLKHTLLSLSDWESKYKKPYINSNPFQKKGLTRAERLDYIRSMTLNPEDITDDNIYQLISPSQMKQIDDYIADPMTATTVKDAKDKRRGGKFITAELIYYWMSTFNIPYIPCQEWHLNKLLTLIKVCSEESKGPQKTNKRTAMEEQRALNQMRRQALGTKG